MEEYAAYHRDWVTCYPDTSTLHWTSVGQPRAKKYIIWRLRVTRNGFADSSRRAVTWQPAHTKDTENTRERLSPSIHATPS